MELSTTVYVLVAALIGGAFAYLLFHRDAAVSTLPTAHGVLTAVQDAFGIAAGLVQAAEQLSETGTIAKDARFNYVYTRLRELFPTLSEDILIAAIEAGVHLVNSGVALLTPDSDG